MNDSRWLVLGFLMLTGCSAGQPVVEVASWEETARRVAKHSGKVTVIDLWAKW